MTCSKTTDGVHVTVGGPETWREFLCGNATLNDVCDASHCELCGEEIW